MLLIFTDGACLSNGQAEPRAGWAIIDGEDARGDREKNGGDGEELHFSGLKVVWK